MESLRKILSTLLKNIADKLDTGEYDCDEQELNIAIDTLSNLNMNRPLSKAQACSYLNLSRSTFDTYIRNGWIPKGQKTTGFKELSWKKSDLDKAVVYMKEKGIF